MSGCMLCVCGATFVHLCTYKIMGSSCVHLSFRVTDVVGVRLGTGRSYLVLPAWAFPELAGVPDSSIVPVM